MKTPLSLALLSALFLPIGCQTSETDVSASDTALQDSVVLPGTPRVGEPFDFAFPALDGNLVSRESLHGKVVVLDFWATWCGPCKREIPHLKELYAQYHDQGLEIVGLSFDKAAAPLRAYVEDQEIAWPQVLLGPHATQVGQTTGVLSIPRMFVLDRQGNLHTLEGRGKLDTIVPALLDG